MINEPPQGGPPKELIGRSLGGFTLRSELGRGGFGVVYLADQASLGREAVVKVLHVVAPEAIQRFLREARIASKLDHPYAAHVYAFGAEPDGVLWVAMEYVRGTPLNVLLKEQGPLPLARWALLIERICEVVHCAHEEGIVHRDLKPANVMVINRAGRYLPKLLDFGIAKLSGSGSQPTGEAGLKEGLPDTKLPQNELTAGGAMPQVALTFFRSGKEKVAADKVATDEATADLGVQATPTSGSLSPAGGLSLDLSALSRTGVAMSDALNLTMDGGKVLGSPHYMAPEQWLNSGIDGRTDQYALGVMSFELLTGKRPIEGSSVLALAKAHMSGNVASLPDNLPAELNKVLRRAMSVRPADRYVSVLDFASALRKAVGQEDEADQFPQMDPEVRESAARYAPQPLAHGVLAIEGARSLRAALQACHQLTRTCIRYLATLALAARLRVGPGQEADSPAVLELFQRLSEADLTDSQWLELATQLVHPFLSKPQIYPIPPLLPLLTDSRDNAALTALTLLAYRNWGTEEQERDAEHALQQSVQQLSVVCAAMGPLFDYQLIVGRNDSVEAWTGFKPTRAPLPWRGPALKAGEVALADADNCPVLTLSPVAKASSPTPGAPAEIFFFAGRARHGARMLSLPLGFEQSDEESWTEMAQALPRLAVAVGNAANQDRPPYRGLATFTADDASDFYGREREVEAFTNRLRVLPFLAVVGPSGAGKSSFIQAGVVPILGSEYLSITVRPGASPIAALADRLSKVGVDGAGLKSKLSTEPELLGSALRALAKKEKKNVLLIVDQFEELVTLCGDLNERRAYAEALVGSAKNREDPVRIVVTLRDDFLVRLQQIVALRDSLPQGLQLLTTPAPEDLLRILVEPARRVGFTFEDERLTQEMVKSVVDEPGALALLSFTATKLWELRDRHFRRLTWAAYTSLGGVGGALAFHAEETMARMPASDQGLVREAFRHLVTPEGTRSIMSRREMLQVLGDRAAGERVLETFINARLLVASEGDSEDRIEVIHEALIRSWPRLVEWQREEAETARLRHQLRSAARQWEELKRAKGVLWRGEALMEYRVWRARYKGALTEAEEAFVQASLRDELKGKRIRTGLLVAAITALSVGMVVLFQANTRARAAAAEARSRLIDGYVEQGRFALTQARHWTSLVYLTAALKLDADGPALQLMRSLALGPARLQRAHLMHEGPVFDARFSPDSRYVATFSPAGGFVWSAKDGHLIGKLAAHDGEVKQVAFAPDGLLASAGADKTVRLWQLPNLVPVMTLTGHTGGVGVISFSPDGKLLASAGQEGTMRIWDRSGKTVVSFPIPEFNYEQNWDAMMAWGKGNRTIALGLLDNSVGLWSVQTGKLLQRIRVLGHTPANDGVIAIEFDHERQRLAIVGDDGIVHVWNVDTGREVMALQGPGGPLQNVRFSADEKTLWAAGNDGILRIWDLHTGKILKDIHAHHGTINSFEFDAAGQNVITGSDDGSAKIWDVRSGDLRASLEGDVQPIPRAHFSPDGRLAVSASVDGSAILWTVADAVEHQELPAPPGKIVDLARSADGQTVGVATDQATYLWSLTDLRSKLKLEGSNAVGVAAGGDVFVAARGAGVEVRRAPDFGQARSFDIGSPVKTIAVSKNRLLLATDQGGQLRDLQSGAVLAAMGGSSPLLFVLFTPDEKLAVAGAKDGRIWVVDASTGRTLRTLNGPENPWLWEASPDSQKLAVVGRGATATVVLTLPTDAQPVTFDGKNGYLLSAHFDPQSAHVVTVDANGIFAVWDAKTGAEVAHMTGDHQQILHEAIFDGTGDLVYLLDFTGTLSVWEIASSRHLASIERGSLLPYLVPGVVVPRASIDSLWGTRDGRIAVANSHGQIDLWTLRRDHSTAAELTRVLQCKSPVKLGSSGQIVPAVPGCP